MLRYKENHRVLSIYPTSRGYAFVLFESALSPEDWGNKDIKGDVGNAKCIASIRDMLDRSRPDVLVLEDPSERQTKRSIRIRRILKAAATISDELSVDIALVKRKDVRAAFAQFGATNKQDIAEIIARKMEAFAVRLPRARKAWQAEDHRMAVFDAASRGLTYYYRLDSNGQ